MLVGYNMLLSNSEYVNLKTVSWYTLNINLWIRNQYVITSCYYKNILIRKNCVVKLECQLAFFFETLKLGSSYEDPSSCREGFKGLNFDYFKTTETLENSMWLIIQVFLCMLHAIFRHTYMVISARNDKRSIKKRLLGVLPEHIVR